MRINIGEVTFNTEFAHRNFGSRTFFILGGSYYQCKNEKLRNPSNYFFFFKVHYVN